MPLILPDLRATAAHADLLEDSRAHRPRQPPVVKLVLIKSKLGDSLKQAVNDVLQGAPADAEQTLCFMSWLRPVGLATLTPLVVSTPQEQAATHRRCTDAMGEGQTLAGAVMSLCACMWCHQVAFACVRPHALMLRTCEPAAGRRELSGAGRGGCAGQARADRVRG